MMRFTEEPARALIDEGGELFRAHWQLIGRHREQHPLAPDFNRWLEAEKKGLLACFGARIGWALKGYAVFIVQRHWDYPSIVEAKNRVIYIDPAELRGLEILRFKRFLEYCDGKLKERGVNLVIHHVKYTHDFSPLLKRLGYEDSEKSLEKML